MAEVQFECVVAAPLQRVWDWYQQVRIALPILSPPEDKVSIVSADEPMKVGGHVVLQAQGPLGRIHWVAEYTEVVEPHAVAFGLEARFVDQMVSGPFATWRHSHEFEALDSRTTRAVDRIEFRVPYGPIGWIASWLIVRPKLTAMFAHRHRVLKSTFQ